MRSRSMVSAGSILLLVSLLIALMAVRAPAVEGDEARQLLETALAQIETPGPGQVVHQSYTLYHRGPQPGLEPADPYHLPYEEIWPARQFEDTWLEISPSGETVRWRTQLRSEDGELLQDLLFEDGIETDYMVETGFVNRFAQKALPYREPRKALIEDFLQQDELERRATADPNGRSVIGVYGAKAALQTQGVEQALAQLNRPFMADLRPAAQAMRIDFDPVNLLPTGEARVVWDEQGAEHVVSYRAYSQPEILSAAAAHAGGVFQQEIPDQALQDSFSAPPGTRYLTALDQIVRHVDYPLYVLDDSTAPLQLVAVSLTIPASPHPGPGFLQDIEFAAALGVGVQTIYVSEDDTARLTVLQGPFGPMRDLLRQTRPTWTQAERIQIGLGDSQVVAWELIGLDPDQVRYVIEAGDTILHLNGHGLAAEQILELLQNFTPAR